MDIDFRAQRQAMVKYQLEARGISDEQTLWAMREVPRELFLPELSKALAYQDGAVQIAEGQTMSQPIIVAMMTQALELKGFESVLEIGVGSGYGAAVLSLIAKTVYGIERHEALFNTASKTLEEFGARNVHLKCGDGNFGWPEAAPFAGISVTAGAKEIPPPLLEQLAIGGRLVIPVGPSSQSQRLLRIIKTGDRDFRKEDLGPVAFVPFVGTEQWSQRS